MEPVIQLFILLFGFILGFILYELTRYRIGGIVAIPIMVIYVLDNPVLLPIFLLFLATHVLLVVYGILAHAGAVGEVVGRVRAETGRDVGSEKLLEVVFDGTKPVRAGDQFGIGNRR